MFCHGTCIRLLARLVGKACSVTYPEAALLGTTASSSSPAGSPSSASSSAFSAAAACVCHFALLWCMHTHA